MVKKFFVELISKTEDFLKSQSGLSESFSLLYVLAIVFGVAAVIFVSCFVICKIAAKKKGVTSKKKNTTLIILGIIFILFGSVSALLAPSFAKSVQTTPTTTITTTTEEETSDSISVDLPVPDPEPLLKPHATEKTSPKNQGITWEIISNGSIKNKFTRPDTISFASGDEYAQFDGIFSFRGDNYRSGATFSTAEIKDAVLTRKWNSSVGSLNGWGGCGWTGQPLVVRWDKDTKAIMNMYPEKKNKENLVEAIYATLDGRVYFYDMEDGSYTRDPLNFHMSFKGAGALDPRGYPLLYLGSGLYNEERTPRIFVVSLIDGKILYEQSGTDPFNYRSWGAFDSSPLLNAQTDTLIWPGENGIIYTIKLNTKYNKVDGKISVKPENVVKVRYKTKAGRTLGFESSIIGVGEYLFAADNGGVLLCFNANTMELIWAQNVRDDVNASPVFEWGKNSKGYLYVTTSMEYAKGNSYIFKIDAETGEIIWEKKYSNILKDPEVSGGILGTPMLGKKGTTAEGLIIFPVGKTDMSSAGILVALDTETGKTVWKKQMSSYAWSSPTAVYSKDSKAYVLSGIASGNLYLIDAKSGEIVDTLPLNSTIESSPVVFENNIILGTRGRGVFGIEIS